MISRTAMGQFFSLFFPPPMDGKKFDGNDSSNDLIPRLLIRSSGRCVVIVTHVGGTIARNN